MSEAAAGRLVPLPPEGRTFTATRRARFGDLSPGGRLRLDALARYVQDVSSDDTADAGLENDSAWVVRRTVIEVAASPGFRELLSLTTFCSGMGGRWAERRVSVTGELGAVIETGSLWVHLDARSGRPVPMPPEFHTCYDVAAHGRVVSARLQHGGDVPPEAVRRPWALRFADFDLLAHVNNAATWAMVEDVMASRPHLRPPMRAELEFRLAIERDDQVELAVVDDADGSIRVWMLDAAPVAGTPPRLFATATVRPVR
jgi:acyl-ACP thioesterase